MKMIHIFKSDIPSFEIVYPAIKPARETNILSHTPEKWDKISKIIKINLRRVNLKIHFDPCHNTIVLKFLVILEREIYSGCKYP